MLSQLFYLKKHFLFVIASIFFVFILVTTVEITIYYVIKLFTDVFFYNININKNYVKIFQDKFILIRWIIFFSPVFHPIFKTLFIPYIIFSALVIKPQKFINTVATLWLSIGSLVVIGLILLHIFYSNFYYN